MLRLFFVFAYKVAVYFIHRLLRSQWIVPGRNIHINGLFEPENP